MTTPSLKCAPSAPGHPVNTSLRSLRSRHGRSIIPQSTTSSLTFPLKPDSASGLLSRRIKTQFRSIELEDLNLKKYENFIQINHIQFKFSKLMKLQSYTTYSVHEVMSRDILELSKGNKQNKLKFVGDVSQLTRASTGWNREVAFPP